MSLVPQAVKLDIAREKAEKKGPLDVNDMLAKVRGDRAASAAPAVETVDVDVTQTGDNRKAAAPVETTDVAVNAPSKPVRIDGPADGAVARSDQSAINSAELFAQARALHAEAQIQTAYDQTGDPAADPSIGVDELKAAAAAEEWRRILAQAEVSGEAAVDTAIAEPAAPTEEDTLTTAALPVAEAGNTEIVGVMIDAVGAITSKEDDLKIRLLQHGKRFPAQIVIGRVEGAPGFEAMSKALALGKALAAICGGDPGISYDPSLSAGAAELHYPAAGAAS